MEPNPTVQPVQPPENQIDLEESVDLCFMLDCTGSMQSYINMARNRVQEVIVKVQEEYPKSQIRIGIVAYRDVQDSNRFEIFPFETSSEKAKQFLSKLMASGGGDTPEDVNGAFQKTLFSMKWQNPIRLLVHIADAPCHGTQFHSADDSHPKGYKEDMKWDQIFKELVAKRVNYLFIKILQITDKMFQTFNELAEKHGLLEAELSFQQEQIPIPQPVQHSMSTGIVFSSATKSLSVRSAAKPETKSMKKSLAKPEMIKKAKINTLSPLSLDKDTRASEEKSIPLASFSSDIKESDSIRKTEECFVGAVTKNIKKAIMSKPTKK